MLGKLIVKEVPIPNAPVGFTMPQISDVYLADIEVNSGDSGAPVYDIESCNDNWFMRCE